MTQLLRTTVLESQTLSPERATAQLAVVRMKAKFQRSLERFRSPRRMVASILALVLAVVWIGQAATGILLRESADPERLALWIPLSLTGYAIWNILKITFQSPVEPFEWTESEREWLIGAPLQRSDLIKYRFRTIVISAMFKSTIFALVMIPDLSILPMGLIGMFGGLIFIDLIRMSFEVLVYGLSRSERITMRCAIGTMAFLSIGFAVHWAIQNSEAGLSLATVASLGFLIKISLGFVAQANTWAGDLLTTPFQMFSDIVLANRLSTKILLKVVFAFGLSWSFFLGLIALDRRSLKRRHDREVSQFEQIRCKQKNRIKINATIQKLSLPARLGGIGPLAWRQFLGARKYQASLIAALSVPFVLGCLPAFADVAELGRVMNIVAGLAFYSFLLLPAAFKFDFRRDVNRMAVLKALPFPPFKTVTGQLAVPVLLTSLFQAVVMLATHVINPYQPILMLVSLAVLFPLNVFIFSFENLFFLWFPYRLQEEGIQVFLRSILAFTAKGIIFVVALCITIAWVFVSRCLANYWVPEAIQTGTTGFIFLGLWTSMVIAASIAIALLTRAFNKFDPSCDLAGVN